MKSICEQTLNQYEPFFIEILCGFSKAHSTQQALFKLWVSWQNSIDKQEVVVSVLMDLSKACDSLPHDLLLAKLDAHGLYFL